MTLVSFTVASMSSFFGASSLFSSSLTATAAASACSSVTAATVAGTSCSSVAADFPFLLLFFDVNNSVNLPRGEEGRDVDATGATASVVDSNHHVKFLCWHMQHIQTFTFFRLFFSGRFSDSFFGGLRCNSSRCFFFNLLGSNSLLLLLTKQFANERLTFVGNSSRGLSSSLFDFVGNFSYFSLSSFSNFSNSFLDGRLLLALFFIFDIDLSLNGLELLNLR